MHDLMREHFARIGPAASVAQARDLMYEERVRHLPIVDEDGRLVGLVTHRDLVRDARIEAYERPVWLEQERLEGLPVARFMKTLVETVEPTTPIEEAGRRMLDNLYGSLPVVDDERLVGMLTEADFVRYAVGGFRPAA